MTLSPDGTVRVDVVPRLHGHREVGEARIVRARDGACVLDLGGTSLDTRHVTFPATGVVALRVARPSGTETVLSVDVEAGTYRLGDWPVRPVAAFAVPSEAESLVAGVCPECGGRVRRSGALRSFLLGPTTRCRDCGRAWER